MTRWLAVAVFLTISSMAVAMEDTPENRQQQVDRYFQAVPPQAVFEDLMSKMFNSLPADQREMFVVDMGKGFDFEALTTLMRAAMVKTFTADELGALADFYGSPIGKSAMGKMGDYMATFMADFVPLMNAGMAKLTAEAEKAHADRIKQLGGSGQQPK